METTVPFARAISVQQLPFAVLSDNVFLNGCMYDRNRALLENPEGLNSFPGAVDKRNRLLEGRQWEQGFS